MTEKRFNIVPSNVVEDGKFIQDNKKEHSFPTTKDTSTLVMYEKALNELATKCSQLEKENEQLKKENQELRYFKLSIKAFAECNDNINRRTLNDLIGEIDYAIIDELGDFPPIMVQMEGTDDGSESHYADRRGVLHLMNQLADTNPNEQRHFYLKHRSDKVHNDNDLLRKENEQLKEENKKLKQDNDIKFWKLQYMRQHNSTQLIVHEVLLAMEQGYELSDEFKKYIDDLKENNEKVMEKNKRVFGDVE